MYADNRSAYGFGMRVVGTEAGAARVLWIQPQGPAEQAGIRVGDRVSHKLRTYHHVLDPDKAQRIYLEREESNLVSIYFVQSCSKIADETEIII